MRKVVLAGLGSAVSLVGLAAAAVASSFIAVAPPQDTPSIVSVGEAAPAPIEATPVTAATESETEILAIGNSVVAIGADAIPPSHEEVASVTPPAEPEEPALPGWLAGDGAPALRGGIGEETPPQE